MSDVPQSGSSAQGYAGDVSVGQAWRLIIEGNATLVDVRTEAEWHYVGVPDLESLGQDVALIEWVDAHGRVNPGFNRRLAQVVREGPVVLLCRSGQRSISAARAATDAGLGPAYNVLDGFEGSLDASGHRGSTGWRAEGLPWRQS